MRKLALLLGSLVVVASASAKEVVPAPVVVENKKELYGKINKKFY